MKKLFTLMLALVVGMLCAEQALSLEIISNASAEGTVYPIYPSGIFEPFEIDIAEGLTQETIYVENGLDPEYITISVSAYTEWGAWLEETADGFYGNPSCASIQFHFVYPVDAVYYIYSNQSVDNAEVKVKDNFFGQVVDSQVVDLQKGWNNILFADIFYENYDGFIYDCHIEAIATSCASESYTITSSSNYTYNSTTGCYENDDIEFTFENKLLHSNWNWESFPKLERPANSPVLAVPIFESIYPSFDWFEWESTAQLVFDSYDWIPSDYTLQSSNGGKLQALPPVDRIYEASGSRLAADTQVSLQQGWNWIGYWLPHSQMSNIAFGEHWNKVRRIKTEDWYYDDMSMERATGDPVPISTQPKPLHYGEGYYVLLREDIPNFSWYSDNSIRSQNFDLNEPDSFSYDKKADYEVIDVVEIDSSIQEIGVFEDGKCVGGVKVDDTSEQILVYSDRVNRSGSVFSFQVITSRTSTSLPVTDYKVYNSKMGDFTDNTIYSGQQAYSIVKLGQLSEESSSSNFVPIKHTNHPNPFNPRTKISYQLPKSALVEIVIYDVKGRRVKKLVSEHQNQGSHSIVWEGDDSQGNQIASGIYFYQIKANGQTATNKILLLK